MKMLFIISLFAVSTAFFACNSAYDMSTNGSDTSSNGHITDPPVADTAKTKSKSIIEFFVDLIIMLFLFHNFMYRYK